MVPSWGCCASRPRITRGWSGRRGRIIARRLGRRGFTAVQGPGDYFICTVRYLKMFTISVDYMTPAESPFFFLGPRVVDYNCELIRLYVAKWISTDYLC